MDETTAAVRYEFTGRLTLAEKRHMRAWLIGRRALRNYVLLMCAWLVLIMCILAIDNRDRIQALTALSGPFLVSYAFFIFYYLVLLGVARAAVGRNTSASQGENTVRFFENKLELVTSEGYVIQFPPRAVRLLRTRRGIVCLGVRGAWLFFLPNRVLTPEQRENLPRIYAASTLR